MYNTVSILYNTCSRLYNTCFRLYNTLSRLFGFGPDLALPNRLSTVHQTRQQFLLPDLICRATRQLNRDAIFMLAFKIESSSCVAAVFIEGWLTLSHCWTTSITGANSSSRLVTTSSKSTEWDYRRQHLDHIVYTQLRHLQLADSLLYENTSSCSG